MNQIFLSPLLLLVVTSIITACLQPAQGAENPSAVIVRSQNAGWAEDLAAREVRRYVYLRTGRLFPILTDTERLPAQANVIVVSRKDRNLMNAAWDSKLSLTQALQPQEYRLKTIRPAAQGPGTKRGLAARPRLLVLGGDDPGVLYAAYRFAETLGVRFYLHGDVVPDQPVAWKLPDLDERRSPLFAVRGIQPFHDFPEGPDWWNREDYLAVIGQLPKLGMNFFGLHTYPEARPNAEPTVWIGLPEDIGPEGSVRASYSSSYMNTLRGNWGYASKKTSQYVFGAAALFERDDFSAEVMAGFNPAPKTDADSNELFRRTAVLLRSAFSFAHQVGVKTCVGTETPLIVPKAVQERLKAAGKNPADLATITALYEGMFRRIQQAYPLDYYWFWTPEGWTWSGTKPEEITATTNDLFAAIAAHRQVQPGFGLATCGWVLGPQQDRAMFDKVLPKSVAVSCINRQVGYTPVDAGFAQVEGRSKWAIPWMEDDPALTSPQLWVGRMRRDAADARQYGCDGLLGIHWRTRVLAPNVAALAQAAWSQEPWIRSYQAPPLPKQAPKTAGAAGGQNAAFPNNPISGTADPVLYQTVRYNLSAYHIPASNGLCRVTLQFSEPHYAAAGKRVFDVKLQGQNVITNLDIFARVGQNRALDFTFDHIPVTNGWMDIEFVPVVEFPSIAALVVESPRGAVKINCGGPAYKEYAADIPSDPALQHPMADSKDFYLDWATAEFGPEAGPRAAAVFSAVDGRLPVPSVWTDGPGGIQPDPRLWDQVKTNYAFVDTFAALRPEVRGPGNQDRFDYWLRTWQYFRTIGEINCTWGEYNRAIERAKLEREPTVRQAIARQGALPLRLKLVRLTAQLYAHLLSTVSNPGELGTVMNWEQHNLPVLLGKPGEELAQLLDTPLPPEAQPSSEYRGPTRLIVPTLRTSIAAGEQWVVKAIVLSEAPVRDAYLQWRKLGQRQFNRVPLAPVSRGVYQVALPAGITEDFEYYVSVKPQQGSPVVFPATAPKLNQTVVVTGSLGAAR
jgi:hypothetical protein